MSSQQRAIRAPTRLRRTRLAGRGWRSCWRRRPSMPREKAIPEEPAEVRRCRLEAILFMAREPLSSRKLAKYAQVADGTEVRRHIRELNRQYDQLGRAFRVEEVAGGFQLRTRPQFADWLRRLGFSQPPLKLSAPALETLSVVAYRQPVLRAEVEAIRGVQCTEMLKQLMSLDLVRIAGRSEELGRPYLYGTTRYFLEVFGLRSLDQLPNVNIFRHEEDDSTPDEAIPPPPTEATATEETE